MPEPISFPTETSSFALPLLFAGQAQKEFFVNQALVLIDSLMGRSVVATQESPPGSPAEGESYRIGSNPVGEWAGYDDNLASWVGGTWQFVPPFDGLQVFDRAASHFLIYRGAWVEAPATADPQGGSVIDIEARAAIAELSQALRDLGLLQASP